MIFAQKHSFRDVLRERCSANMKQTHWRTAMQKWELKKFALKLY